MMTGREKEGGQLVPVVKAEDWSQKQVNREPSVGGARADRSRAGTRRREQTEAECHFSYSVT